jgi:hypothetical protein
LIDSGNRGPRSIPNSLPKTPNAQLPL